MSHVFVSYKHDDGRFVDSLREKLKEVGFETWADIDIKPGEQWKLAIDKAIKASFAVVVILTPDAHTSPYVTYEWSYAMGIGCPVIPILLKNTELHPKLQELQHLNFIGRNSAFTELVKQLHHLQSILPRPVITTQHISSVEELQPIIDNLTDLEPSNREAASITLGELHATEAVLYLVKRFQDASERVVIAAIQAVGQIGSAKAVPALVNLLNRRGLRTDTYKEGCYALARIGGTLAIQHLIKILETELNLGSKRAAGFALIETRTRLGMETITPKVAQALKPFCKDYLWRLMMLFGQLRVALTKFTEDESYIVIGEKETEFNGLEVDLEIISAIVTEFELSKEYDDAKVAHKKCKVELDKHTIPF